MRRFVWWVLVLGLVACSSPELECADPLGCVLIEQDEPLLLAFALDTTGAAAALSQEIQQGMELALAERENSLLEHEIALQLLDTMCSETGGAAAATQIAGEAGVVAVLGPVCAESATGMLPLIAETGGVLVSPANTNPQIGGTAVSAPPYYFRTIPHYLHQAEVMARFAAEVLEAETAVVMFNDTPYSEGLREAFGNAFLEAGGTVPFQTRFDAGSGLEVMLQVAALNEPDVIYLPLYEAEATTVLNQAGTVAELSDTAFLGPDSLLMPSFMQGTGAAVTPVYVSGYAVQGPVYDAFSANWRQRYGRMPTDFYAAYAYDAATWLLAAIEESTQRDSSGALLIGRQALRLTLAGTSDFAGVTGVLTCTEAGECADVDTVVIFRLTERDQLDAPWPPLVVWPPAIGE